MYQVSRRIRYANQQPQYHLELLDDELDANEREHAKIREEFSDQITELKAKVDRLTWALATAALSFGIAAIMFVVTGGIGK